MESQEAFRQAQIEHPAILLVDDDPAILEGVADLLELHGYEVSTAINGREALAVMQRRVPDLVISDIMMPDMDGYEFFNAVRSNPAWTPIPFVFLTARGQPTDIRRGSNLGADAYLTKPFEPEDLLVTVRGRLKRVRDIQAVAQADIDRMKQQLITIFSHELRTPLTYIYGYVNLLQEQHANLDRTTLETMLDGIQRGADRLVRLVEDLMLVVRIDSGVVGMEIMLRRVPVQLDTLIAEIVLKCQPMADEHHVTISVSLPEGLAVFGMPLYLEDALARIVDNAIKFCKQEGGRVTISAEAIDREVVISVRDDGIGIEPTQHQAIFERFLQLNRDSLEQQGIGLGLTIARDIVRLHGGDISVESEVGVGSVFFIHLPLP